MLTDETRRRVVEAARALGYRPNVAARNLRMGRSGTLGVIVADLSNPFLPPVLRGIENTLGARGVMPIIVETGDESERLADAMEHLSSRRTDALIITAVHLGDAALVAPYRARVPLVLAVRSFLDDSFDAVLHDDEHGTQLVLEHLVGLGHREIAEVRGPLHISSFAVRTQAFGRFLTEAGSPHVGAELEPARSPTIAEGLRLGRRLLSSSARPTAVFAHNDLLAVGVLEAARELSLKCPDDISIVGYNDSALIDHLDPPLTSVRLNAYELGRRAADRAHQLMSGTSAGVQISLVEPTLAVRASTGPPAARFR